MLITRPFTDEEVADQLDAIRAAECVNPRDFGILAEASRRLHGWLPSGADNQNALIIKMGEALIRYHADHAENHASEAVDAYDDWCKQFLSDKQAARLSAEIGRARDGGEP